MLDLLIIFLVLHKASKELYIKQIMFTLTCCMTLYVCVLHLSPCRRCIAAWSFSASPDPATSPTTLKRVGWGIPAAFCDACGEDSN